MIPVEKYFNKIGALGELTGAVLRPPETLFPDRTVETLDVGLLIFLVWSGYPMSITKLMDMGFKFFLELRSTVGLEKVHVIVEPPFHGLLEKLMSIGSRELWCAQDICFS